MVNTDTNKRPINNPLAARNWDLRQKQKAAEAANGLSKRQALREISKASRQAGRETRTGMVESGLINTEERRKSSSW